MVLIRQRSIMVQASDLAMPTSPLSKNVDHSLIAIMYSSNSGTRAFKTDKIIP